MKRRTPRSATSASSCSTRTIASSSTSNLKDGGYDTIDHQATRSEQSACRACRCRTPAGSIASARPSSAPQVAVPEGSLDGNPFQQAARTPANAALVSGRRRPTPEGTDFRPRQGTAHRLRPGHRPVRVSHARRLRRLPRPAGRRRRNQLSHRRQAAEGAAARSSRSSISTKAR